MRQLGVLAKYWQPGEVKTRLAAGIGAVAASRLYRGFLEATLNRCTGLAQRNVLAFTPPERHAEFAILVASPWRLKPQSTGDLGQRMHNYFAAALEDGATRVVLIGADSPNVPREHLERAFHELQACDVVLGPATDGGYYLIGVARRVPPIFEGVDWSTRRVCEQTIERIRAAALRFAELPPWYDVDELEDLTRLRRDLAAQSDDPQLAALARLIEEISGCPPQ